MVFVLGLRDLQRAIDEKANAIQKKFVALSLEMEELSRNLLELRGDELEKGREEQAVLRDRQAVLADEINLWRERARKVVRQKGDAGLRAYLDELLPLSDGALTRVIEKTIRMMDAPEEELVRLAFEEQGIADKTPVDRLIERARTSYDLRGSDISERQRAAVEFANRSGMAMDNQALAELEAAIDDSDPLVREVASLTLIQMYRFRATRIADLTSAHESAKKLANFDNSFVIPALIEILENPRTGFIFEGDKTVESDNSHSRMVALLKLVKWHTPDAKKALYMRRFDQDSKIVSAAARALELFPGEWKGSLEKK